VNSARSANGLSFHSMRPHSTEGQSHADRPYRLVCSTSSIALASHVIISARASQTTDLEEPSTAGLDGDCRLSQSIAQVKRHLTFLVAEMSLLPGRVFLACFWLVLNPGRHQSRVVQRPLIGAFLVGIIPLTHVIHTASSRN
jgi:hypothetical protein